MIWRKENSFCSKQKQISEYHRGQTWMVVNTKSKVYRVTFVWLLEVKKETTNMYLLYILYMMMSPLKPVTMEQSPLEHTWGSDTQRNRYKGATVERAGLRQRPLQDLAQARDIYRNRPKQVTSTRAGLKQWSPKKQVQGKNHWGSRTKPAGQSQRPPLD